jgi:hypothetical protein
MAGIVTTGLSKGKEYADTGVAARIYIILISEAGRSRGKPQSWRSQAMHPSRVQLVSLFCSAEDLLRAFDSYTTDPGLFQAFETWRKEAKKAMLE